MDGPEGGQPPAAAPSRAKLPLGIVFSTALFCGESAAAAVGEPLARASAAGSAPASAALLALSVFFLAACTKKDRPPKAGRQP